MTRNSDAGHAALVHRVRLGIGASRRVLQEQGPHGSAGSAQPVLPAVPHTTARRGTCNGSIGSCSATRRRGPTYARLCSICGTAGLLRNNRTAKPAYAAFRSFTAETTPPVATIVSGPAAGGFTNDPTPTFTFTPTRPGSTFLCHYDANPFATCSLAQHQGHAAHQRRPHLLRQGDGRPRQRVDREVALVHGRHGGAADDDHLRGSRTAARPPTTPPPSGSAPPRRARPSSAASTPSPSPPARVQAPPIPPPPRSPPAATASRSGPPTRPRTSTRRRPSARSP